MFRPLSILIAVLLCFPVHGGPKTAFKGDGLVPPKKTTSQRDALTGLVSGQLIFNTTTGKTNVYNGSAWVEVGSGSGGINFLSPNHDAEGGTTSWSTYADAAATTPVDCTGGSPNATWTASSSSPLEGTNSYLFTKDAANRQGEGVSTTFSVAAAYRAKQHVVRFYYKGASSWAAEDVHVYIKPTDGSDTSLIQPSAYKLTGSTSGPTDIFEATFQTTSDATSYRLCLHQASTNASASTLKVDYVEVGPGARVYGAPTSEMVTYTTNCSGSWASVSGGGNVTYTCKERRNGDRAEAEINLLLSGAPTAATLTLNLPHTIDTTKITDTGSAQFLGRGRALDSGTGNFDLVARYSSTTAVEINSLNVAAGSANDAYQGVNATTPITWANADEITVYLSYPVSGWGSQVQFSDTADGRVVGAKFQNTAATTLGGLAVVPFVTTLFDTHSASSGTGTSWVWTAPIPGKYHVEFHIGTDSVAWNAGNSLVANLKRNGSTLTRLAAKVIDANVTTNQEMHGSTLVDLAAGDTIAAEVSSSQSVALNNSVGVNYIAISRVGGNATIASGETVAARYRTAAGLSIANGGSETLVDFDTKVFDTHGFCTTGASFKCTTPAAGYYEVCALTTSSGGNWTAGETWRAAVFKNNSRLDYLSSQEAEATSTSRRQSGGCIVANLVAGDYVDVRVYQDSGGAVTMQADDKMNYITVRRIP